MNKFHGILTEENLDIVTSTLSAISVPEKQKINLIETISNIIYIYENYFNSLDTKEKINALAMVAFVFDTLLDAEINPLAKKYITLGLNAFNNNIFSVGGNADVSN